MNGGTDARDETQNLAFLMLFLYPYNGFGLCVGWLLKTANSLPAPKFIN